MAIISGKWLFVVSVLVVSSFLELTNGDQLTDEYSSHDPTLHKSLRFRIPHRHRHRHRHRDRHRHPPSPRPKRPPPTPPTEEPPVEEPPTLPPPVEEPPVLPPSGEDQSMPPPPGDEPPCRCDAPSPSPSLVDDQP